jgi:hypothetical protein
MWTHVRSHQFIYPDVVTRRDVKHQNIFGKYWTFSQQCDCKHESTVSINIGSIFYRFVSFHFFAYWSRSLPTLREKSSPHFCMIWSNSRVRPVSDGQCSDSLEFQWSQKFHAVSAHTSSCQVPGKTSKSEAPFPTCASNNLRLGFQTTEKSAPPPQIIIHQLFYCPKRNVEATELCQVRYSKESNRNKPCNQEC